MRRDPQRPLQPLSARAGASVSLCASRRAQTQCYDLGGRCRHEIDRRLSRRFERAIREKGSRLVGDPSPPVWMSAEPTPAIIRVRICTQLVDPRSDDGGIVAPRHRRSGVIALERRRQPFGDRDVQHRRARDADCREPSGVARETSSHATTCSRLDATGPRRIDDPHHVLRRNRGRALPRLRDHVFARMNAQRQLRWKTR